MKIMYHFWLLFFLIYACGYGDRTDLFFEGTVVPDNAKCLNIVDGVADDGSYNYVGLLVGKGSDDNMWFCTGTFIAHNAMITASHCIDSTQVDESSSGTGGIYYISGDNFDRDTLSSLIDVGGIQPINIKYLGPTSDENGHEDIAIGRADVAVLLFPDNTATDMDFPEVSFSGVSNESPGIIAGFGYTSLNSDEVESQIIRRYGRNTIKKDIEDLGSKAGLYFDEARVLVSYDDSGRANIASGDSGGPLFSEGKFVGVGSASDFGTASNPDSEDAGLAYFVDFNEDEISTFLDAAFREFSIIPSENPVDDSKGDTITPPSNNCLY